MRPSLRAGKRRASRLRAPCGEAFGLADLSKGLGDRGYRAEDRCGGLLDHLLCLSWNRGARCGLGPVAQVGEDDCYLGILGSVGDGHHQLAVIDDLKECPLQLDLLFARGAR